MFHRRKKQANTYQIKTRRLGIERMEHRKLMAADIALDGGILDIDGTNEDDVIRVQNTSVPQLVSRYQFSGGLTGRFSAPPITSQLNLPGIEVTIRDTDGNLKLDADGNELKETFLQTQVDSIHISAGSGDDHVVNSTAIPSEIHGGNGNDTVQGGSGVDQIDGGWGADRLSGGSSGDVIEGGPNNDTVYAGSGDDQVVGESGNDKLSGGTGDDTIHGGSGNDSLTGSYGNDLLYGESGHDTVNGGSHDDDLYGGTGNDKLYGTYGDDGLFGGGGKDSLNGGLGDDRFLVVTDEPALLSLQLTNLADPAKTRDVSSFRLTASAKLPQASLLVSDLFSPINDEIEDLNDNDAKINFVNGQGQTFNFSGGAWSQFDAGAFSDEEIELVDQSL